MKKKIPEYSRYEIDSNGKVYDTQTGKTQPTVWNGDFLCTNLIRDDGIKVLCKIHRLVAITFVENPHKANRVVHKDGDRSNNSIENIVWQPKKVKELSVREEPTYEYCGQMLTLDDVAVLCGSDKATIKRRLKAGWSVVECKLDYRHFTGEGFETQTHWFPNKKAMKAHLWEQQQKVWEDLRREKERRKQERVEYKKYGVGIFVNEPIQGIINRVPTKCYRTWDAMLARCYNPEKAAYARYGGRGVTVCEEWKTFQNFAEWYESTYKEDGWQIEKDILSTTEVPVYGPETCVFTPASINTFFARLPKGEPSPTKYGNRWVIQNSRDGKKFSNCFKTEREAINSYWEEKVKTASLLADEFEGRVDSRVISVLRNLTPPKSTHQ